MQIKVGDTVENVRFFHCYKRGVDRVFVDHPIFLAKVCFSCLASYKVYSGVFYNELMGNHNAGYGKNRIQNLWPCNWSRLHWQPTPVQFVVSGNTLFLPLIWLNSEDCLELLVPESWFVFSVKIELLGYMEKCLSIFCGIVYRFFFLSLLGCSWSTPGSEPEQQQVFLWTIWWEWIPNSHIRFCTSNSEKFQIQSLWFYRGRCGLCCQRLAYCSPSVLPQVYVSITRCLHECKGE